MQSFFKGKKVLITGHTGFKGSWLTQILHRWGANVVGIALPPNTTPNLFSLLDFQDAQSHYETNILDEEAVLGIFQKEKPEVVFHLAAQPLVRLSYEIPELTFKTNVLGTVHVLHAIRKTPSVRSAVIITTDKVYNNTEQKVQYHETDALGGHDPYSASKAAADMVTASYIKSFFPPEKYPHGHQTLVGIARAGNVLGGGDWSLDRLVPDIIRALYHSNTPVVIRNPQAVRPWQHVLEPLNGYLQLAKKLYEGEVGFHGPWNFGPSEEVHCTVEEMVQRALAQLGRGTYRVEHNNLLHENQLLHLDSSKARSQLNWNRQLDLDTSLKWVFDWYRAYYEKNEPVQVMNKQIDQYFSSIKA